MPNAADQCRARGLKVNDTIEGTESGPGWWSTTRLTLLWVGEDIAVWRETSRCSLRPYWPEWSEPREVSNWTLRNKVLYESNASGEAGVSWSKDCSKWRADIYVNRRQIYGGVFVSFEDALAKRKQLEAEYGFHNNHGAARDTILES